MESLNFNWPLTEKSADALMKALPVFVGEANRLAEFCRLLEQVTADVQRNCVPFLAGVDSAFETMPLQDFAQVMMSAKAAVDCDPDVSESERQERLLCLLVLQALNRLLVLNSQAR